MTQKIITITREYGSGGRLIAKKVAEALNIAFYDNELIDETARQLGIDIDTIRKAARIAIYCSKITMSKGADYEKEKYRWFTAGTYGFTRSDSVSVTKPGTVCK